MFLQELTWQQFSSLPNISKLPQHEQERQYRIYLNEVTLQRFSMLQEQISQQEVIAVAASSGGGGVIQQEGLPPNTIEFVVDTTNTDVFEMEIDTNSQITATITWGDDQTEEVTLNGNDVLSHTYNPSGTGIQYTVRIVFSDATQVTRLEFYGND